MGVVALENIHTGKVLSKGAGTEVVLLCVCSSPWSLTSWRTPICFSAESGLLLFSLVFLPPFFPNGVTQLVIKAISSHSLLSILNSFRQAPSDFYGNFKIYLVSEDSGFIHPITYLLHAYSLPGTVLGAWKYPVNRKKKTKKQNPDSSVCILVREDRY